MEPKTLNGILLVDKPSGWTSFDIVNKVRSIIEANNRTATKTKKRFPVGHTGTLDPLASGLLVLVLGDYTKRASEINLLGKSYSCTLELGKTSQTGDSEGQIVSVSDKKPSKHEIEAALKSFLGNIEQVPPIYSAIKINGQRAYKLARSGKDVELNARMVTIHQIKLEKYQYPEVSFSTNVSSGTYIRSLVEDIGKKLATGAYLKLLRRTQVGEFSVQQAIEIKDLDINIIYKNLKSIN